MGVGIVIQALKTRACLPYSSVHRLHHIASTLKIDFFETEVWLMDLVLRIRICFDSVVKMNSLDQPIDVFLSYATVNNPKVDPWVSNFYEVFKVRLDEALGKRGRCNMYMDFMLRGSEPFDTQLETTLVDSTVLLIVLSRGWLESQWCRRELELFAESANRNGGTHGRIFLAHYEPTNLEEWPDLLQGLSDVKFRFYGHDSIATAFPTTVGIAADSRYPTLIELREEIASQLKSLNPKMSSLSNKEEESESDNEWLDEMDQETWRDRANSLLRKRTAAWLSDEKNARHYPSAIQLIQIVAGVSWKQQSDDSKRFSFALITPCKPTE